MLGTAHSNNGINIVVADVHRRRGADLSQQLQPDSDRRGTAARPTIFYIDKDFANSRLMQANAAVEWEFLPRHEPDGDLSLRRRHESAALDRSQPRHARRRDVHRRRHGRDVPVPLLRRRPAVLELHARHRASSRRAESRYNGLTLELNRRFANHLQCRAAYTLGKVEDTVPDATAVVPGNAGDDVEVRVEPGGLRRRSHRRQQRPAAPPGRERRSTTRTASTSCRRLDAARSSGTGRSARSSRRSPASRTRRASAPSTSTATATRATTSRPGTDAQPVPAAVDRHVRPAHRARHPDRASARLQLIWEAFNLLQPRQHQRRRHDLLQRRRHDADARARRSAGRSSSAGERIMQLAVKVTF